MKPDNKAHYGIDDSRNSKNKEKSSKSENTKKNLTLISNINFKGFEVWGLVIPVDFKLTSVLKLLLVNCCSSRITCSLYLVLSLYMVVPAVAAACISDMQDYNPDNPHRLSRQAVLVDRTSESLKGPSHIWCHRPRRQIFGEMSKSRSSSEVQKDLLSGVWV